MLAEGEGFEPPVPFRAQWFSRPPPSTTRPSLRSAILSEGVLRDADPTVSEDHVGSPPPGQRMRAPQAAATSERAAAPIITSRKADTNASSMAWRTAARSAGGIDDTVST